MNVNFPVPRSVLQKREDEARIKAHPEFEYLSRPGDGVARYVFRQRVCLGVREAIAYVEELEERARFDAKMESLEPVLIDRETF